MRKKDAFKGKYLSQEDFPNPTLVTVDHFTKELVMNTDTKQYEDKTVMYVRDSSNPALEADKGFIVNDTNWDAMDAMFGMTDESDNWVGHQVVIFCDPSVKFKGKVTGGTRIRAPQVPAVPNQPAVEEPPPPPEPMPDDVPF